MAVETVTRTTCDRCPRVIEEVGAKPKNHDGGQIKPRLYVEADGVEPIRFDDLCDKCTTRVDHLLKQLRLEKDGEDDKKPEAKDTASAKKSDKKDKGNKPLAADEKAAASANFDL